MTRLDRRSIILGAVALPFAGGLLSGCAAGPGGFDLTEAIRRLLTLSSQRAFALLLQPADPEAWRPVWLRLQHVLHSHKELSAFSVGCSLGAASWHSGMDVPRLYATADAHLYARKKAGVTGPSE